MAKMPRIVDVEAATPAGYRWLRQYVSAHPGVSGATLLGSGAFSVTNESRWAEALRSAQAKELGPPSSGSSRASELDSEIEAIREKAAKARHERKLSRYGGVRPGGKRDV